jgi:hypothetical protein
MKPHALAVRKADDGSLVVEEFVPIMQIVPQLLCYSPLIETIITVTAANGSARYRITDCSEYGESFTAVRIDDDAR